MVFLNTGQGFPKYATQNLQRTILKTIFFLIVLTVRYQPTNNDVTRQKSIEEEMIFNKIITHIISSVWQYVLETRKFGSTNQW